MNYLDIFLIAIGLSMDAFAVSLGKGMSSVKGKWKDAFKLGVWFGSFQGLMPLIGYFLIVSFSHISQIQWVIENFDHWIAFSLLALIGGKMIKESFEEGERVDSSFTVKSLFVLAVATSIDALATGITFGCVELLCNIFLSCAIIALTTFVFSVVGLFLGALVGSKFHKGASIFGGIVLISIGLKILIEHL